MPDEKDFNLGDILWEYADYTPPEMPSGPSVPLTSEPSVQTAAPSAPAEGAESPASEENYVPKRLAEGGEDGPELIPTVQSAETAQAPEQTEAAQTAQPAQEDQETETAEEDQSAEPSEAVEEAPTQDEAQQPTQEGDAPAQPPNTTGPPPANVQPPPQKPQEEDTIRLRREREPRPGPEVPPDAPPAQLAEEYSQGFTAGKTRAALAGVVSLLLLLLSLLESSFLPALSGILPMDDALYLPVGSVLFLVCAGLCYDVLRDGLVQLTNKAPNEDTLALFAVVFLVLDTATLITSQLRPESLPFFAPCALVLTLHLVGKVCLQSARRQACRVAASVSQPYVVTQDPNVMAGQPAFRKWQGPPKGFGSQVRTLSGPAFSFQRLTPVLLVACICVSLITTVAHHQPRLIFWSLSALFLAASTLGVSLTFALPLRLVGRKLSKLGVALAGWPGVDAAGTAKHTVLHDQDIYPPGSVTLLNSEGFNKEMPIERVLIYTASVIRASGSGLTALFEKTLREAGGGYTGVEAITMQETGLIGVCQGQQVLVGNSDFMSRQGVNLPPGVRTRDAVFCAIGDGSKPAVAMGMFVLKYALPPSILPALGSLFAHRFRSVLATRDFNLSPQRLRLRGRLPTDYMGFPDLQRRVALSAPDQPHGSRLVAVLCREGLPPFAQALVSAKRVRRAARINAFLARLGAILGVILTGILSSAGALSSMCAWNLSLFLLLWFLPILIVSLWVTQY